MSGRTFEANGERWRVSPTGRITQYGKDEFATAIHPRVAGAERGAGGALLAPALQGPRIRAGAAERRRAGRTAQGVPALVDDARLGVPPLSSALPIDLHMHSTASDGVLPPAGVVRRAAELGLGAIALTDHDTVDGVAEARRRGSVLGVRVVSGCEFSTAAPWGEMHVLGYFLPADDPTLNAFLVRCREDRVRRAREMVEGLQAWGVDVSFEDVAAEAGDAAIGRPHLARVLVRLGKVASVEDAFREWLGRGRPAYVEKRCRPFARSPIWCIPWAASSRRRT